MYIGLDLGLVLAWLLSGMMVPYQELEMLRRHVESLEITRRVSGSLVQREKNVRNVGRR